MEKLGVIRLSSSAELGSLEDTNPEKRMTIAHIRKLRRQAHQQTQMRFSIARSLAHAYAYVTSAISLIWAQRAKTYCVVNGHSVRKTGYQDYSPECRYCGVRINSIDELQSVR